MQNRVRCQHLKYLFGLAHDVVRGLDPIGLNEGFRQEEIGASQPPASSAHLKHGARLFQRFLRCRKVLLAECQTAFDEPQLSHQPQIVECFHRGLATEQCLLDRVPLPFCNADFRQVQLRHDLPLLGFGFTGENERLFKLRAGAGKVVP